jgi:DNA-binding NarL/FixJ family response regulator
MAVSFYLSYARADASTQVKRFFDDLSDTIRIVTNRPPTSQVGFYEDSQYQSRSDWSPEARQALGSSHVMICLLSPAYFHDARAGKEWQIFEMRRRLSRDRTTSLTNTIIPICWNRWHGAVPLIVNEVLANPDQFFQRHPIKEMLKPAGGCREEYAELVKVLAYQLIELPDSDRLPEVDHVGFIHEVNSLFHLWADAEAPVPGDDNHDRGTTRDQDFIKSLPLHINVTLNDARVKEPQIIAEPLAAPSESPEKSATVVESNSDPTRVFIIEDHPIVRDMFTDAFSISGFLTQSFERAELAADKLYGDERPDLCLVDMQLPGKMQGIDFIKKLTDSHDLHRPSIVAVSGTHILLEEAIKAGAVAIEKPPGDYPRLVKIMRNMANQGKKRRLYTKTSERDRTRDKRPVFLSFSSDHRRLATGLKSHLEAEDIGVWYSPDLLADNEAWRPEVINGIDDANVFLAFITEGFLNSNYCWSELDRFNERRKRDHRALLLPIFYSPTAQSDLLKKEPRLRDVIDGQRTIDLSVGDFLGGIQDMVRSVLETVGPGPNVH